jgi:hypothetical protein
VTLRRSIVFGVCAVGVACLYLVPSIAGTPTQLGAEPVADESNPPPAAASGGGTARPATTGSTQDAAAPAASADPSDGPLETGEGPRSQRRPARGAIAYDPNDTHDHQPPSSVSSIRSATTTPKRLNLAWAAATDDVGVVGYRIWVNGFAVATTAETHASVRWFNDDSGQHVVQVRAIDAEGNESATSPTLVVTRPSTEPTPIPTPTPSATPSPTPTESPTPTPADAPTQSATIESGHASTSQDTDPSATSTAPGISASPTP